MVISVVDLRMVEIVGVVVWKVLIVLEELFAILFVVAVEWNVVAVVTSEIEVNVIFAKYIILEFDFELIIKFAK